MLPEVKKLLFLVVNGVVLLPRRFSVEIHPDLLCTNINYRGEKKAVFLYFFSYLPKNSHECGF